MRETTPLMEVPSRKEIPPSTQLHPVVEGSAFVVIAIAISAVHYLYRVSRGEIPWAWLRLFTEAMVGGVAGYLSFSLCMYLALSSSETAFMTCIAGWDGPRVLAVFEELRLKVLRWRLLKEEPPQE